MATATIANDAFILDGPSQEPLTNFTAEITQQLTIHEPLKTSTVLVIKGKLQDGTKLPEIEVDADQLASMSWVPRLWGTDPIIFPVHGAEKHIKTAIQVNSKPKKKTIYRHIGWRKDTYLHAGGAINAKGNDPNVTVQLPPELSRYNLAPEDDQKQVDSNAVRNSLALHSIAPTPIAWPLLLAAYRPILGPVDYAFHLAGRTGTFKSELCALIQAHYGDMDARTLPASWSSTANALEALAYYAANATLVVDDFVPHGTAWQVRALQKTADQIFRGQGNQAGRARLSDTTRLNQTFYPRGIILSTGEDVPTGHSIRARIIILDLTPGDVQPKALTAAQSRRRTYRRALFEFIRHVAANPELKQKLKAHRDELRPKLGDLAHARTPSMTADMIATAEIVIDWAREIKAINDQEHGKLIANAKKSIILQAKNQRQFLESTDPTEAFVETIQNMLGSKQAHMRNVDGTPPHNPEAAGWTEKPTSAGVQQWGSNGPRLGWIDWKNQLVLVDINAFSLIQRHAQGRLALTRQTLLKRLKDASIIARVDDARQRNTIRVKAENATRQVAAINYETIMGDQS